MSDTQVKEFWEARAQDHSLADVETTHRDVWQRMAAAPEAPTYDSPINRTAAQLALHLQDFGAIGRVAFLVLRKKP